MEKRKIEELRQKLIDTGQSLGAAEVNFANLESLDEKVRRGYTQAVSIVVPLSKGILKEIEDAPTITYFSHYRTVNRLIDMITLRLMLILEQESWYSLAVPASQSLPDSDYASVFSHKAAATLSGSGWIGKSALFVHYQYGPAVRLGTVLTNAPLAETSIHPVSKCGNCKACQLACPAMAIEGNNWEAGIPRNMLLNAFACSNHMTTAFQHSGRGAVCGLCIVNCPHFKNEA